MNQQVAVVEPGIVMISVEVGMFGGYKRTNEQDIVDAGGVMPDCDDVMTKGGKRIFPNEKLKAFGTVKKGIVRDLWKHGVKALGGGSVIAFPEQDLPEVEKILEQGQFEFFDLIAEFWNNYQQWLNDYIASKPKGGEIIRRSALTREEAISHFYFRYEMFKPTPVGKNGSIESMAQKFTNQLYSEVAQAAFLTWNVTFNPLVKGSNVLRARRKVGQKALSPIRACRDKLEKLSFLNPFVKGAVQIIDDVLATMPKTGYIENTPSNPADSRLFALVCLMKDGIRFANAAEAVMKGAESDDLLNYNKAVPQAELVDVMHDPNAVIQVNELLVGGSVAPLAQASPTAFLAEKSSDNEEELFF